MTPPSLDGAGGWRAVGAAEDRPAVPRARARPTRSGCCDGCRWRPRISSRSGSRPISCRPRSPRAAFSAPRRDRGPPAPAQPLLLNAAVDPAPGGSSVTVKGGPGALTRAMADAAREAGAEIRTGAGRPRDRRARRACSRASCSTTDAKSRRDAVISNADPKRTFLGLVDPVELDPSFLARHAQLPQPGNVREGQSRAQRAADVPRRQSLQPTCSGRMHIGTGHRLPRARLRRVEVRRDLLRTVSRRHASRRCTIRRSRRRRARDVGLRAVRALHAGGQPLLV